MGCYFSDLNASHLKWKANFSLGGKLYILIKCDRSRTINEHLRWGDVYFPAASLFVVSYTAQCKIKLNCSFDPDLWEVPAESLNKECKAKETILKIEQT